MNTFKKSAVALATLVAIGSAQANWTVPTSQDPDLINNFSGDSSQNGYPAIKTPDQLSSLRVTLPYGYAFGDYDPFPDQTIPIHKVIDGVIDQNGDGHYLYKGPDGSLYLFNFETLEIVSAKLIQTKTVAYRGRTTKVSFHTDEELASKTAEFERSVDKQVKRLTKEAVVGAVVVNVIADEFINPALKDEGVSAGATVSGGRDNPEVHVGVSKDLGDGVFGNVGVGTSSGNLSVGVSKSVDLNDHVRVGVGASYSDAGWSVGPSVQFHDGNGNGVGVSGVIPTVTVAGYTVAVIPQLFVPNLVVIGARALYNWVRTDK